MIKITFALVLATAFIYYFSSQFFTANGNTATETELSAGGLHKISSLPSQVKESSGIIALSENGPYLTHNDAGNAPNLYKIDNKGQLQGTITLDVKNVDWEDLTKDDEGNIYIADTGNNDNKRKDLTVYKMNPDQPSEVQAIRFVYEDQKKFPPAKKERNFDCEAVFWHDGNLYLISKDRGRGKTAKVYTIPDTPGQHTAKRLGEVTIGNPVTGAALSPDASSIALLSESKVHLFRNVSSPENFYQGKFENISLKGAGQTEGITFLNNNTLIITSEGGNLYKYNLN